MAGDLLIRGIPDDVLKAFHRYRVDNGARSHAETLGRLLGQAEPIDESFGDWRLDMAAFTLDYLPSDYWINLSDCTDSASVLDWIVQLSEKTWMSDAALGQLVRALDDLFHLQGTVCGFGVDHKMDPRAIVEASRANAETMHQAGLQAIAEGSRDAGYLDTDGFISEERGDSLRSLPADIMLRYAFRPRLRERGD